MRASRFIPLVLVCLLAAQAALAQEPAAPPPKAPSGGASVRRQVSDARVLSSTSTCFFSNTVARDQAKRLCSYSTRAKLLDTAVSQLGTDPAVAKAGLGPNELRAFVDSLLAVHLVDEDLRTVSDGLAVRQTLHGETTSEELARKLAGFTTDPRLKATAMAETAARDRLAAEARMAAIPFAADRVFRAKEMVNDMDEDATFAERNLVPGMSFQNVKTLLGTPSSLKESEIGPNKYQCAGYGRIFVVFRDGLVACLRSRLDYVARYDTDCHCSGNYATILRTD